MAAKELNTTAYAILSLLAVRPWTTYELAQQMERSLGHFWPRATSGIYEEPKKLVAHGLAQSRREYTGRRRSTIYEITPAGRTALRRWLDKPGTGPTLEFEALIKIAFADHGDIEQLRANIAAIAAEAERRRVLNTQQSEQYGDTGGPYPHRLPVIALAAKLIGEQNALLARWAEWAQAEVATWTGLTTDDGARIPTHAFTPGWPDQPDNPPPPASHHKDQPESEKPSTVNGDE